MKLSEKKRLMQSSDQKSLLDRNLLAIYIDIFFYYLSYYFTTSVLKLMGLNFL